MDDWYTIEGEIIGWFSKDDPFPEQSIAVVRIDSWLGLGNSWRYSERSPFPVYCLRWLGHDYAVTTVKRIDEDVDIGDGIKFATCRREQEEYAK